MGFWDKKTGGRANYVTLVASDDPPDFGEFVQYTRGITLTLV